MCKDQVNRIVQLLLNCEHVNVMLVSSNVLNVKSVECELVPPCPVKHGNLRNTKQPSGQLLPVGHCEVTCPAHRSRGQALPCSWQGSPATQWSPSLSWCPCKHMHT